MNILQAHIRIGASVELDTKVAALLAALRRIQLSEVTTASGVVVSMDMDEASRIAEEAIKAFHR